MALVIGLTGGIGSGKTTVSNLFSDLGIDIVDADVIARQVVALGEPALKQIQQHFGEQILAPDGQLDRSQLRQIVFANPAEKAWLEALLHPIIRTTILDQLGNAKSAYVLLVAPLLLETNLSQHTDKILVIDVPKEIQISRTLSRDNTSLEQVEAILQAQISRDDRLAKADFTIDNTGDLDHLRAQVETLDSNFRELSRSS